MSQFDKVSRWFERPASRWVITAAAVVLVLPSLSDRLVMDDYLFGLFVRKDAGIAGVRWHSPWDLYTYTTGNWALTRALVDEGVLMPWWTDPRHFYALFRPFSSLSHWVDFRLWPSSPLLMHLHGIAWFVALLLAVAWLYNGLSSAPWLSGFAFLLYALDDAHGVTLAWITNRHLLIVAVFSCLALGCHHKSRSQGWRLGAYLGPAFFAFALAAGETGLAAGGYLLAYALVLERGAFARRLLSLWGFALVFIVWLWVYRSLPFASFCSNAYRDPVRDPVAFIQALFTNLPLLLAAQLTVPFADFSYWSSPLIRAAIVVLSWLMLAVIGWIAQPLLRRDRLCRFWTLSTVLAAIPIAASIPSERVLVLTGLGASPLMAQIIALLRAQYLQPGPHLFKLRRGLFRSLILLHVVMAPILLPMRAVSAVLLNGSIERANRAFPMTKAIADKTVVFVNAPMDIMVSYLRLMRAYEHQPGPAHSYWLSTASSALQLRRVAARTLRITPREGFIYLPAEQNYRTDFTGLSPGSKVQLSQMQATIMAIEPDGRPRTVDFAFTDSFDSGRILFMVWDDGAYKPFIMPAVGRTVTLSSEYFYQIVLSEPFRLLNLID